MTTPVLVKKTHSTAETVILRQWAELEYSVAWQAMRSFTDQRTDKTYDELWCLEHPPVFTQGQAGKPEHVLNPGQIPVIQTDRGGQITYHGPGQLVIYILSDIRRKGLGIRTFVSKIENAVIMMLADYKIKAYAKTDAPGVYVEGAKICALGLRIRRGASYHGLSLNVNMDLSPFSRINPCGFSNLAIVQMKDFMEAPELQNIADKLTTNLCRELRYERIISQKGEG